MLNSDSRPTKPAAIVAMSALLAASSAEKPISGWPISLPPKISCSIGEAIDSTPMPADTLRQSTAQISQNCGVLCASLSATASRVIIARALSTGGVQPSGASRPADAVAERAGEHEHEIADAQDRHRLPDADGIGGLEMGHQQVGERRADHRAAAEAHDRHAGRHAAPVRETI